MPEFLGGNHPISRMSRTTEVITKVDAEVSRWFDLDHVGHGSLKEESVVPDRWDLARKRSNFSLTSFQVGVPVSFAEPPADGVIRTQECTVAAENPIRFDIIILCRVRAIYIWMASIPDHRLKKVAVSYGIIRAEEPQNASCSSQDAMRFRLLRIACGLDKDFIVSK